MRESLINSICKKIENGPAANRNLKPLFKILVDPEFEDEKDFVKDQIKNCISPSLSRDEKEYLCWLQENYPRCYQENGRSFSIRSYVQASTDLYIRDYQPESKQQLATERQPVIRKLVNDYRNITRPRPNICQFFHDRYPDGQYQTADKRADCSGIDFTSEQDDHYHLRDLSYSNFNRGNFQGAIFKGANLWNVSLLGALMEGAELSNVEGLSAIQLSFAVFSYLVIAQDDEENLRLKEQAEQHKKNHEVEGMKIMQEVISESKKFSQLSDMSVLYVSLFFEKYQPRLNNEFAHRCRDIDFSALSL